VSKGSPKKKDIDPKRKVYIYCLKNPATCEVKYIGWSFDTKRRLYGHIYEASNPEFSASPDSYKNRWIRKLLEEKIRPVLEIVEETTYDVHEDREKFWIKFYGRENLTNGTDGGDGSNFKGPTRIYNNYYLLRKKLFYIYQKFLIKGIKDYTMTMYGCEVEDADKNITFKYKRTKGGLNVFEDINGKDVTLMEYYNAIKNMKNPFLHMDHDKIDEHYYNYELYGNIFGDPYELIYAEELEED
jgi:hypothetical protein